MDNGTSQSLRLVSLKCQNVLAISEDAVQALLQSTQAFLTNGHAKLQDVISITYTMYPTTHYHTQFAIYLLVIGYGLLVIAYCLQFCARCEPIRDPTIAVGHDQGQDQSPRER